MAGVGAYKIGEARKIALQKNSVNGAVYLDLQKAKSNDSILNEALKKISSEQLLSTSTAQNPFTPSKDDTLTDSLAKNIFLTYAEKQDNDSTIDAEAVSANIIGSIDTSSLPKNTYSLTNVKILRDQTPAAIKDYGNKVGAIIKDNYEYIAKKKDTIQLPEIAKVHQKIGREIINVSAPAPLASYHLAIANDYTMLGDSFAVISTQEKKDPLKSLLAVNGAKNAGENLEKTYTEINSYFAKNGILFSNDEPGIVWTRIVLK